MIPWWVLLYMLAYVVFAAWAFGYDVHSDTEPTGHLIIQATTDVFLLSAGFAYWDAKLHAQLAPALLAAYIVGIAVFCWQIVAALRHSELHCRSLPAILFRGRTGATLWCAVSAPMIYWGFCAAVLSGHASD